jgi:signal transduction histidine kinase
METARETGKSENERWHVRKDGSRFWGLGILTALRGPSGELIGYAKIMRDRTDIKEVQEQLKSRAEALADANRKKTVFLAILSHEMRNPLGSIVNATQALRIIGKDTPKLSDPIEVIERQSAQLKRLVDDLLDLSRISTGKVRLQKTKVELNGILKQAAAAVAPFVQAQRHRFEMIVPPVPVWLEADPARLQQIFVNLLTNACKYTNPGGEVDLSATIEDNEAVIRVRDTGMGISADMLPRIFELFTQAEEARSHSQGGLGIGLNLVRNLVDLHGGSIQARSDGEGKGSEFTVRLPVLES